MLDLKVLRLPATVLCAAGFAAAVAGSAPAVVAKRAAEIVVTPEGSTPRVDLSFSARAPAPATVALYGSQGFGLTTEAAGSTLGYLLLDVLTDTNPLSPAFVLAQLSVGDPSLATDAVAQSCAPGPHASVWTATPTVAGQLFPIRIYVDPTSGAEAALGAFKLVACFPSPYVPASQGGAPDGAQVSYFSFFSDALSSPGAKGTYVWRLFTTPYLTGTATPDAASTFEARSRVLVPDFLTLKARYQKSTRTLIVTGRLEALGQGRSGTKVELIADVDNTPKDTLELIDLPNATTKSDGSYLVRHRIAPRGDRLDLSVSAFVDPVPEPCLTPTVAPGGCVGQTLSGPAFVDTTVTIPSRSARKK